jgi:hypothetical protein
MRLVYDPRKLSRVTTARTGVTEVLQMVSEPILTVSRACTSQRRGYVCMTRKSSERDMVWYIYC